MPANIGDKYGSTYKDVLEDDGDRAAKFSTSADTAAAPRPKGKIMQGKGGYEYYVRTKPDGTTTVQITKSPRGGEGKMVEEGSAKEAILKELGLSSGMKGSVTPVTEEVEIESAPAPGGAPGGAAEAGADEETAEEPAHAAEAGGPKAGFDQTKQRYEEIRAKFPDAADEAIRRIYEALHGSEGL